MDWMCSLALTGQLESVVGGLCLWASRRRWEIVLTAHAYWALTILTTKWESNVYACTLGLGWELENARTACTCQSQMQAGSKLQPPALSGLNKYWDSSCLPVPARQQDGAASELSTLLGASRLCGKGNGGVC